MCVHACLFRFSVRALLLFAFRSSIGLNRSDLIRRPSKSNRERKNSVLAITAHTTGIGIDIEMGDTGGSAPDEVVEDEDDKYNYYECK